MTVNVVILAAGNGSRMRSDLPKVLHPLAGKPLLSHVIDTTRAISQHIYVVYGYEGERLKAAIHEPALHWVYQDKQLGTGHAVLQALPYLAQNTRVLVLYGDGPLISKETLQTLIESTPAQGIGWLTALVHHPFGLGRIVRDDQGRPKAIVEEKDADPEQKKITEINSGIALFPVEFLKAYLPKLSPHNQQGEFYLTDLFAKALELDLPLVTVHPRNVQEIRGVNDQVQLSEVERIYQFTQAEKFMRQGLCLADPHRFDLRGELTIGRNVMMDVNVVLEGKVSLGDGVKIGPNVMIKNSTLGAGVKVEANSVIEGAVIEEAVTIGPFARIRPDTFIKSHAKIGNFVEVKKSVVGEHSKINHLSYVGDAILGQHVNIGAGTITCNYDGANKYITTIEDDVFVGSNTSLIAPVTLGAHSTIGAGSTISKNAPPSELTLTRAQQVTVKGWQRPNKQGKA